MNNKKKYIQLFIVFILVIGFVFYTGKAEAAISYRSSSTGSGLTATEPAGAAQNDILIAFVRGTGTTTAITGPAGWTMLSNVQSTTWSANRNVGVWYMIRGASAPSYTFTGPTGLGWAILDYSGSDINTPINVYASAVSDGTTTPASPSITTTVSNTILISALMSDGTISSVSVPSGMTLRSNNNASVQTADLAVPSASATGTKAWTEGTAGKHILWSVAIQQSIPVTTVASNSQSYNSFDVGITVTNPNQSYFGARFGTSNTGNCSTLTYDSGYAVNAAPAPYTAYHYNVTSNVSASTSYYYCTYIYDQITAQYSYGNILGPITTPAIPAPIVTTYAAHTIDDASAVLPGGVIGYGVGSFFTTFRWGTSNVACTSLPNNSGTDSTGGSYTGTYPYPKTYTVTGLTPGTTYYFCFYGSSASGSTSGSVLSFTTAASAGSGCDLLPSSVLASSGDKTTLAGYLGTSKMQGTLLYKATVNGWSPTAFHTNSDGQGATLTLIKNNINNKIFGGYNPQSWDNSSGPKSGAGAFLFSLSDGYKLAQSGYAYQQTYNNSTYGPTFGWGYEIGIPNNNPMNTAGVDYTNPSTIYETPASKGAFTYLDGGGGSPSAYNFTPSEIEVYKISVCTAAAPTITTPTKTSITATGATLGGNVTSGGTQSVTGRGVCVGTSANPAIGGTCFSTSGTTGVFTVNATGLTQNTLYHYRAYATNSVGTSYTTDDTFTTATIAPLSVTATAYSNLSSYKVTMNGSVNPNGSPTRAHFRYYTSAPDCTSDSGGMRLPSASINDTVVGSDNSIHTFSYTNTDANPLLRQTNYWYCAYADNDAAPGSTSTSSSAGYVSFTTPDGPASACDAPASGNLTINSTCSFPGAAVDGVDAGGSGTSNTAGIILQTGGILTVMPGQAIARGGIAYQGGGMIIANGGLSARGGVWVKDTDGDGVVDNPIVTKVSATQPAGYMRRNYMVTLPTYSSSAFNYGSKIYNSATNTPSSLDCDGTNPNIYQNVANLVKDTDNDGYKTVAAAATQCVGGTSTINGRTYYKDATGGYTWLALADALGGGATDCNDATGAPCAVSISAGGVTQTSTSIAWSAATGPAPTSYNLYWCTGSSCTPSTQIAGVSSTYSHTGRSCGTVYGYKVLAVNAAGTSPDSNVNYQTTSSCAGAPIVTTNTITSITNSSALFSGNFDPNGGSTNQYQWWYSATSPANCASLTNVLTTSATSYSVSGTYTLSVTGLSGNTTYYVCARGTNSIGTTYGGVQSFTTSSTCYRDADGDGYGNPGVTGACGAGYVANNTDCYDSNANAHPGQASFFSINRGDGSYDYDCNGSTTTDPSIPSTAWACASSESTQSYNSLYYGDAAFCQFPSTSGSGLVCSGGSAGPGIGACGKGYYRGGNPQYSAYTSSSCTGSNLGWLAIGLVGCN